MPSNNELSIREVLDDAARRLEAEGIESPRRNAEWLLCEVLELRRAGLYANLAEPVAAERRRRFEVLLQRRLRHEPLQHILGYTEFCGLRLMITPDVLIPRPETEELAETAIRTLEGRRRPRILDAGTGSGCLALAIKAARRDAQVYACDVSAAALDVARRNAAAHDMSIAWFEADMLGDGFADDAPGQLDLIVSNPPYVARQEAAALPTDVKAYEPHLALFAPDDPVLFYRRLAVHGLDLLRQGGWIVLETHADYARAVGDVVEDAGYTDVAIKRDLAGRERIAVARRV